MSAGAAVARLLLTLSIIAGLEAAGVSLRLWFEERALAREIDRRLVLPDDPQPDLLHRWFDVTPVTITHTAGWQKFATTVPRYQFYSDPTLWARMHFEDWDNLGAADRDTSLRALLARSGGIIRAGDCWPVMRVQHWDAIPQPVRAVAILGVIEYWTRYYAVGEEHGHDIEEMVRTVQAVVMSESWFEHRSVLTNGDGTRDLGIAGASAFARKRISQWKQKGRVDFSFFDEDYFNPWHASRFVAYWFKLMLDEAEGDVDVAIRAYNQGISRARRGHGDEYLAGVLRRRRRFMETRSPSPTWTALLEWRAQRDLAVRPPCHREYGDGAPETQRTMSSPRMSAQPDSARILQ